MAYCVFITPSSPPVLYNTLPYRCLDLGTKADFQTTIRVKFSDGTQIQSTFASTSAIQPVYAFVRTALKPEYADKSFNLCMSRPLSSLPLNLKKSLILINRATTEIRIPRTPRRRTQKEPSYKTDYPACQLRICSRIPSCWIDGWNGWK